MDSSRILLACIVSAVFGVIHSELDEKNVKRNSESDKYESNKYYSGNSFEKAVKRNSESDKYESNKYYSSKKSEKISSDNTNTQHDSKSFNSGSRSKGEVAKYTEEKGVDASVDKEDKQYDTDNTGKDKGKFSGVDYGSDYKGYYDGGDDNENDGKKEYSNDNSNDVGYTKDTYTSTDNRSPEVTCYNGVKFIAHPYECTKFYQCAHSKPFLFTCPSGLYFNTDLDVCDWPSNVDCFNGDSNEPSYKTNYKTSDKSKHGPSYKSSYEPEYKHGPSYKSSYKPEYKHGPSYKSSHEPDYKQDHEYKVKSNSHRRTMTTHKSAPPMYENTDEDQKDQQDEYHESKTYSDSHSSKDNSKYKRNYHSMSSHKPASPHYPMTNPYQHMMAPFLPVSAIHFPMVPVMQSPIYHQFVPVHTGHSQSPIFHPKKADDNGMKPSDDHAFIESSAEKEIKKQDDSTYQTKKTESSESKTQTSHSSTVNTGNDGKSSLHTVKKVIIKKSRPVLKQDVSGKDKTDDTSSKLFYYYYYDDDNKDNGKKESGIKKDENKNTYYYYIDDSKSDAYKDKRKFYDYDNKYDYDYGNNYYYGYEDSKGHGHSRMQHLMSVDNKYNNNNNKNSNKNNNRKYVKTSANYMKANEMSDDELGVIHFNHMGRKSKTKAKGEGLGDIGSLLPLLLLGGANGGQQLLITSLLLSNMKSGGGGKGAQTKGKGEKDDLIKQLVLLSLLTGNGNNNNNNIPTVNVPNVQLLNGQFVNIATGQPAVLIDPATGQQVTPAQVSVNPATGQLIVTATGNPVFVQDPATGNLQPAIAGNTLTLQGNPLLPVAGRRRPGRRVNFGANMNNINNRFIPLAPSLANQNAAPSATGRDAVNLIFLSPLTPSSLPPQINNDGSATLIRGSLRDILGPNLANFISNVPLVPGQGPPNSAAGSKQSCNVVRSGETVPFRISPRGGRLLPSECDAIGKLLDKFVPTFLQNFVPSDAAFAGFGSSNNNNNNNNNRNDNNSQQSVTTRPNANDVSPARSTNVNSGTPSNFNGSGSINDFINVRNDHNGCTIAVPNIVSQC